MPQAYAFEEFHIAVGRQWGERRIRHALNELGLRPLTTKGDARRRRYSSEWVPKVRAFLEAEDNEPQERE